jgi:hypothetical protein
MGVAASTPTTPRPEFEERSKLFAEGSTCKSTEGIVVTSEATPFDAVRRPVNAAMPVRHAERAATPETNRYLSRTHRPTIWSFGQGPARALPASTPALGDRQQDSKRNLPGPLCYLSRLASRLSRATNKACEKQDGHQRCQINCDLDAGRTCRIAHERMQHLADDAGFLEQP